MMELTLPARTPRPSKTDISVDRIIVNKSEADPFKSARQFIIKMNEEYWKNGRVSLVGSIKK